MYNSDEYELIDKFLSNQLSPSEKLVFNELAMSNPDFMTEVEKVRATNQAIHHLGLLETSNKLDQLHKKQVKIKTKLRYWLGGVIVVAVLLGGYGLYKITTTEKKSSITPHSLETTTETITIDEHQETNNSPINKVITNKDIQEDKSPIQKSDSPIKDIIKPFKAEKINSLPKSKINDNPSKVLTNTPNNSENMKVGEVSKEKEPVKIICGEIVLSDYRTKPSCIGEQNGAIIFSNNSLTGGTSPYKTYIYQLDNEDNYLDKRQLASDQYAMKVVDANGCIDTIPNISITEQRCLKRINDSFSPTYGESWEYPKITGVSECTILIKDIANHTILEKQILLDEETDWNGFLENGTMISQGIYFIEIKDEQETYVIGSITIIE